MARREEPLHLGTTLTLADGRQYRSVQAGMVTAWIRSKANDHGQAGLETPEQKAVFKALLDLADAWNAESKAELAELVRRHQFTEEG